VSKNIGLIPMYLVLLSLAACSIGWPKVNPPTPPLPTLETAAIPSPAPTATRLPDQIIEFTAPVLSLAYDPHNRDGLFALLATNDLYYSDDRGGSWQRLPLPAKSLRYDPDVQTTCPLPMQFDIRPSKNIKDLVWVRAGQTLFHSDDRGKTWQARLDNVTNWTASQDGERLFALRYGMTSGIDGLYRSQDGGMTWDLIYPGLLPDIAPASLKPKRPGCISLVFGPDESSLYLGGPDGMYRSFDQGETWALFNQGLQVDPGQIYAVPLMVSDGEQGLYALVGSAEDENAVAHMVRLVRESNTPEQDHWQAIGESLLAQIATPNKASFFNLYALVPDPQMVGQLYLGSEEGALLSRDFGETWEPLELAEAGQVTRIAASSGQGAMLYLWTGEVLLSMPVPGS
jgi:hypothetical protein